MRIRRDFDLNLSQTRRAIRLLPMFAIMLTAMIHTCLSTYPLGGVPRLSAARACCILVVALFLISY
ncbi:hypothetical protein B0H34DRAFT_692987 [Crassisporium funariophilum]|nr:hypothetical protein B0H34DRAFT_692987 [Crassisporium funariophilum]